ASAMTGHLSDTDRARMNRVGVMALSAQQGLELFDTAILAGLSVPASLVLALLDIKALRSSAGAGRVPALLRGLIRRPARRPLASAPGSGSMLSRRLSGVSATERQAVVLEVVRGEIAAVLGYSSPTAVDPDRAFTEAGFDSLTAVELRNRLGAVTRLRLPTTLVFDHPNPAALAAYLGKLLTDAYQDATEGPSGGSSSTTLGTLLRQANQSNGTRQFLEQLTGLAEFTPKFENRESAGWELDVVQLAHGDAAPTLVCIPSILATSGPHEYMRLANSFAGGREILALSLPGSDGRRPLPATFEVLIQSISEAVQTHMHGKSYTLVGHSTGGALAHAMAQHLEGAENPPVATVLIDTYSIDGDLLQGIADQVIGDMLNPSEGISTVDDGRLLAMSAYVSLLTGWEPTRSATPTLLLQAIEPMMFGTIPTYADWRYSSTVRRAPGNHFSMMKAHVSELSALIDGWLAEFF
uniref:alpha/beta fold hydrolase n=1 Tax=Nocardia sp. bgisy118 TaxID=3413786 RepID=UPI003F4A6331